MGTCQRAFLSVNICIWHQEFSDISSFDIRRTDKLEIDLESFPQPNPEGFDQEMFAAEFRQILKLVELVINDYKKL